MKKKIIKLVPIAVVFLVWVIFSSPYFIKGLVPYPSLYQANFFSPWSAYGIYQGPVKNNAMPDIITQIYPWKQFSVESLKNGEIALWNPYSFSGTPHLANYQSSIFNPLNLLFFLPFSFINTWSLIVLLQPLLAGLGMYFYLRRNLSAPPSLFGAISFMFCGFITAWMGYTTLGYAILLLPLALLFVDTFIETGKFKYLLLITLLIPISLFAGHFQTSTYFLITLFGYIIFFAFGQRKKLVFLLISFFLGILVSMPQVLPSIEFYFNSVREQIVTQLEVIPLGYLPTFLAPDVFGNPVTRNDWFGHYAEWNGFSGSIVFLLAIFAALFLIRNNKKIIFFSFLGLVSILMAFDTPINLLIFNLNLPLFSTSASSRVIVLTSFSLAVLGSFGFSYLISSKVMFKKIAILGVLSFMSLVILWSVPLLFLNGDQERMIIARNNLIIPSALIVIFIFSLFLLRVKRFKKEITLIFVLTAVFLTSMEMLRFSTKWMPFEPQEYVFKEVPITRFFEENRTEKRYLGNFSAENSVYYRVQSLGGYDPLYPERYGEFVKFVELGELEKGDRSVVNFPLNSERTRKAMDFLGVEYIAQKKSDDNMVWAFNFNNFPPEDFSIVYEDDYYRVFKNNSSFPRAFLVGDYVVEANKSRILDLVFNEDVDLRREVVLEKDPNLEKSDVSESKVKIDRYVSNNVDISVESRNPAILLLSDNSYDGWKAYVNGKEVEIYRANYSFRSVVVPEGKSIVEFKYEPDSFRYGSYLSALGIIGIALLFIFRKKYE